MSSLGTSLLLLVILAVVLVMLYNLRQSWPRLRLREGWWRVGRTGAGTPAAADAPGAAAVPRRAPADAPNAGGAALRVRGEPRLGAGGPHPEAAARSAPPDAATQSAPPDAAAWPAPSDVDAWPAPPEAGAGSAAPDAAARSAASASSDAGVRGAPAAMPASPASSIPSAPPASAAPHGPSTPFTQSALPASAQPAAAPASAQPREAAGAGAPPAPLLSEVSDCIVTLALASPCPGERLTAIAQRFRRAGGKPVAIEGRADGSGPGDWHAPAPGVQYEALRIGVLMANRHGPLNAMEYSEFVAGVQSIAESLSALADTPDMAAVLARARDLDATCAQLDAQIGVNVEAHDPLGPAQLAGLAGALSVVERGSNRYARIGAQGELVFSVALADVPGRLTFLLDVPRCPPALEAWAHMIGTARECAARLGGRLVDDAGQPLADASLAQIGRQLLQRYDSLEAIGLPAGSPLALKVFN